MKGPSAGAQVSRNEDETRDDFKARVESVVEGLGDWPLGAATPKDILMDRWYTKAAQSDKLHTRHVGMMTKKGVVGFDTFDFQVPCIAGIGFCFQAGQRAMVNC